MMMAPSKKRLLRPRRVVVMAATEETVLPREVYPAMANRASRRRKTLPEFVIHLVLVITV